MYKNNHNTLRDKYLYEEAFYVPSFYRLYLVRSF